MAVTDKKRNSQLAFRSLCSFRFDEKIFFHWFSNRTRNDKILEHNVESFKAKRFACHEHLLPPWKGKTCFRFLHDAQRIIEVLLRLVHRTLQTCVALPQTHQTTQKFATTFVRSPQHLHNSLTLLLAFACLSLHQTAHLLSRVSWQFFAANFTVFPRLLAKQNKKSFSSCWETCLQTVSARLSGRRMRFNNS